MEVKSMKKIMYSFRQFNEVMSRLLISVGAVIIGVIVLSLFAGAVARYMTGSSHAFLEELPRMMIPFVVFPLMGALLRAHRHISVDVVPERLKGIKRHFLMIAVYMVCVVVSGQFTMAGISAVLHFKTMGMVSVTEWMVPEWLIYMAFPFGFGLLLLSALELMLDEGHQLYRAMGSDRHLTGKGKST
jgi:TRAP-type C4-dicarboxylate transport system permease small subunit